MDFTFGTKRKATTHIQIQNLTLCKATRYRPKLRSLQLKAIPPKLRAQISPQIMILAYQLLALDPSEKTRCANPISLLFQIRGFTSLWAEPKINELDCKLRDRETSLLIVEAAPNAARTDETDSGRSFILTLTGPYDQIEPKREPLSAFLKDLDFDLLYVLKDEPSEQIACKLYPNLYRIENLLRGYLIRFMATRIGPRWWELTASTEMTDKAKMRKKNEKVFGKHIENSAFLIDFDDLGELVYKQSSGFLTREDIVARVSNLSETPEAVKALKQELQSNYDKLFKKAFADKAFKDKWKQFEILRNKIAHNNLFTAEDLIHGEKLAKDLTEIITTADKEAQKLVISTEEREAIKEQVARSATWQTQDLTEQIFFDELDAALKFAKSKNRFVGLTNFVNNTLIPKGYSYFACHSKIEELSNRGAVDIHHVHNPANPGHDTAALRRPQTNKATEIVT